MDVMPENRVELIDKENLEVFCTLFENTPSQNLSMMLIAIDRVKRLAELGKDVILIVDGIEGVIDCTINGYNIEDSISGTVNVIAKKIFAVDSLAYDIVSFIIVLTLSVFAGEILMMIFPKC